MNRKYLPAVAALLLVLIGWAILWWQTPPAEDGATPVGGTSNYVEMSAPTAPAPAPAPSDMTAGSPAPAPVAQAPPGSGAPAPDRFIVCPGNPRCPPRQNTH